MQNVALQKQIGGVSGRVASRNLTLSPGRETEQTLAAMAAFVRRDTADLGLRMRAVGLVQDLDPRDFAGQARRIHEFIQKEIRYQRDPWKRETVADARRTIMLRFGDCDDFATLGATLLALLGIPVRFAVCGPRAGVWNHVWLQVYVGGRWIDSDPTKKGNEFGWTPPAPAYAAFQIWPEEQRFPGRRIAVGGELYEWDDGLGFFKKIGGAFKKIGKGIGKGAKAIGKGALKIAPIAAGFIPGVGQAVDLVSGAISGIKDKKQRAAAERAFQEQQAAQAAEQARLQAELQKAQADAAAAAAARNNTAGKISIPGLGEFSPLLLGGVALGALLLLRK